MVERAKVKLNEMTTQERQELYHYVQTQKWLNKKVEFDGEKVIIHAFMHLSLNQLLPPSAVFMQYLFASADISLIVCCIQLLHLSDIVLPLLTCSHADVQVTNSYMFITCSGVEYRLLSLGPAVLQKTIRQLVREVEDEEGEAQQAQEGGVVDYTGRNKTAGLEEVPGWRLRPGAPKMQLRPEEEEQLPLVYYSPSKTTCPPIGVSGCHKNSITQQMMRPTLQSCT